MADDDTEAQESPQQVKRAEVADLMLQPLNHAIAAASRKALELGLSAEKLIELHLNNLASTIAMVEPAEVRAQALKDVQRFLPGLLRQHVDRKYTTPGGVIIPGGPG